MRVRTCTLNVIIPALLLLLFVFAVCVTVSNERRRQSIYGPEIPLAWHNPMPRARGSA